jgi:hypothetical protein
MPIWGLQRTDDSRCGAVRRAVAAHAAQSRTAFHLERGGSQRN